MLIFDQLRKDDPQLRAVAVAVLSGLLLLLAGLWWVQVVSAGYYEGKLQTQSIRSVRLPAVRGRIFDREGRPLADTEPRYNIDLYLEELSKDYQKEFTNEVVRTRKFLNQQMAARESQLGRKLNATEKKLFALDEKTREQLTVQARFEVTSNIVRELGTRMQQPMALIETNYEKWYAKSRALPMPILTSLDATNIARFEEQSINAPGMEMEVQSIRFYPRNNVAAHVLGYLTRDSKSVEGETSDYDYRLTDYEGVSGIEKAYDKELRGMAGAKSVLVNNLGYRQGETVLQAPEPGENVFLTLDQSVQKVADSQLQALGENAHGAVVVLDVRNGDVLAMASAPGYNPNHFVQHPADWVQELQRWNDPDLQVQLNHAIYGEYPPGSVFKLVVGMAALELGVIDPKATLTSPGYYPIPDGRRVKDLAPAGDYNFDRAVALSCNFYFITCGAKPGVLPKIAELGQRLHLGERTGVVPRAEEKAGNTVSVGQVTSRAWHIGRTANLSIGQDPILVTPLQVAVMISAIANGGTVYYPRLVSRIESQDGTESRVPIEQGRIRDTLGVSQSTLSQVHEGMLKDVEGGGTGKRAIVPGLQIAGKTGTAQVEKNNKIDPNAQVTWFASYAPYDQPRYAVVVMVVSGSSGGGTCAPMAGKVYEALLDMERVNDTKTKKGVMAAIQPR